jgi:ribosomal-protein-alanine N-acetyltransferase
MTINFQPFPRITTERLVLRQLEESDAPEIFIMRSDERILKYIDIPIAKSVEDGLAFINKINKAISENESIYWAITAKDDNTLIGTICLWNISKENLCAEMGYALHPDFQGKGIMHETITKIIEYGFEKMNLHSIEAVVDPRNLRSINVLVKNHFIRVANSNSNSNLEKDSEMILYSLTRPH